MSAVRYDSAGRPLLASLWDAIAEIPDNVAELGSLADPAADAVLCFDFAGGFLEWNLTSTFALLARDPQSFAGQNVFTKSGAGTNTAILMQSANPTISWMDSNAATDEKWYDITADGGQLSFRALTDTPGSAVVWLLVDRTGTTIDQITAAGSWHFSSNGAVSATAAIVLDSTIPSMYWYETDAGTNEKKWRMTANITAFTFALLNDADNAGVDFLNLLRVSTDVTVATYRANSMCFRSSSNPDFNFSYEAFVASSFASSSRVVVSLKGSTDSLLEFRRGTTVAGYVYSSSAELRINSSENKPITFYPNNAEKFVMTGDGRFYGNSLHNNGGAMTGTTNQYVGSGTYTPTGTNNVNVASSTPALARWIRVGNVVHVAGRVAITATAGATVLSLGLSLPIASALTATSELSGSGARQDGGSNMPVTIGGDAGNDRASLVFLPENTSTYDYNYTFTYIVL